MGTSLRSQLIRVAHANPQIREKLLPLVKTAGNFGESFGYSPWGEIQQEYKLAPGVKWVSTAGHGGLMVTDAVARKQLSAAAYRLGDAYQGWRCYEEDLQFAIPFYENPEWQTRLVQFAGGRASSPQELESTIKSNFPSYFTMLEGNISLPRKIRPWDTLVVNKAIGLASGGTIPTGANLVVTKVTPGYVYVDFNKRKIRMGLNLLDEGAVSLVE